jgi:hypothetical protein
METFLQLKKLRQLPWFAACIKAETGVGPSIASGSQICNGNIADFPAPPINTKHKAHVKTENPRKEEVVIPIYSADWCVSYNFE